VSDPAVMAQLDAIDERLAYLERDVATLIGLLEQRLIGIEGKLSGLARYVIDWRERDPVLNEKGPR
jgi:hypothetical protein